ncbi:hypothetical protein D3C73_1177450 [compost metagenome]
MVEHQVHHQLHPPGMDLAQHVIEIVHRSELLADIAVIAYIVAVVVAGRFIDRADPDHIYTKILQIIQPGDNAP